ncbi:MAG TPA: vitamin K epoxide reductase family protein [Anaeromyxobacteraceae bacterium]
MDRSAAWACPGNSARDMLLVCRQEGAAMSRSKRASAAQARRQTWCIVAVILSAAGLAVSLVLARIHALAFAGAGPSFCSLGETVNCDRVALSPFSMFLGIPLAFWGAFAYASMLVLALSGLRGRSASSSWPTGLLLILTGTAATVSIPLAVASAFVLRSLCLLCAATWAIDWALFGVTFRHGRQAGGAAQVMVHDLQAIARRPAHALAGAAIVTGLIVGALALYSTTLSNSAAAHASSRTQAPPPPHPEPAVGQSNLTIFEFSDYECPHCAQAHRELRAALAGRQDARLEHLNFPLDQACNPAVLRPLHRSACALARAAICARDQGRFWEMNDALYANQEARRPVEDLAASVGLDIVALRRCVDAPETERRLGEEIAAGVRAGVAATPSYVVGRALYQGAVPARVLERLE